MLSVSADKVRNEMFATKVFMVMDGMVPGVEVVPLRALQHSAPVN
jgi:hypothetical protein